MFHFFIFFRFIIITYRYTFLSLCDSLCNIIIVAASRVASRVDGVSHSDDYKKKSLPRCPLLRALSFLPIPFHFASSLSSILPSLLGFTHFKSFRRHMYWNSEFVSATRVASDFTPLRLVVVVIVVHREFFVFLFFFCCLKLWNRAKRESVIQAAVSACADNISNEEKTRVECSEEY